MTTRMDTNSEGREGMAERIAHFIKYNNAVPITLGILFFLTTGAAAASPEVRDAVYKADTKVAAVDNSYLLSANLAHYPLTMKVTSVAEDDDWFYVAYDFNTIDVVDGVWREVAKENVLKVSKALLAGGNLKAYAESEFAQIRSHELERLAETQTQERAHGASSKVIATTYTGLVGSLLKPTEEAVPQYHPDVPADDPLRVEHPVPLVSWDENQGTTTVSTGGGGVPHTTATVVIGPDGEVSTSTPSTEGSGGTTTPEASSPPSETPPTEDAASTETPSNPAEDASSSSPQP